VASAVLAVLAGFARSWIRWWLAMHSKTRHRAGWGGLTAKVVSAGLLEFDVSRQVANPILNYGSRYFV
jgi:hypothetical protein